MFTLYSQVCKLTRDEMLVKLTILKQISLRTIVKHINNQHWLKMFALSLRENNTRIFFQELE
jgi:hypothetical protein